MVRRSSSRDLGVERTEGLVEQQHFRLVGQRARDSDALLLTAGKLSGKPLIHPLEGDEAEQLFTATDAIRALHATDAQSEFDVVRHGHVTEQRVVLED